MTLLAGIARREITPPVGTLLIGYGNRVLPNIGARELLTATALVLRQGNTQVAIVAADLLAITDRTRHLIQAQVDSRVIICCSHTHSGSISHADETSPPDYMVYVRWLIDRIVSAIREAEASLQSITLAYGQGEATIGINRRQRNPDGTITVGHNPDGVVDRSFIVIQLVTQSGQSLAHIVNFACHPTVLSAANLQATTDWVGMMRMGVERETDVPCLFVQGACGDINPRTKHNVPTQWADRFELGMEVAQAVMRILPNLESTAESPLRHQSTWVHLPIELSAEADSPAIAYRMILASLMHLPQFVVEAVIQRLFPWQVRLMKTVDGYAVSMPIEVLRIGEIAWVGLGAEVFNEIGLRIKRNSPAELTVVSGVTNGCIGYLPTTAEHRLGGYEVDVAPYLFRLPGRLHPDGEARVLESVATVLNKL